MSETTEANGRKRGFLIVILLILAIAGVLVVKKKTAIPSSAGSVLGVQAEELGAPKGVTTGKPLPALIDLGSKSCIPCKMMAPILDELKSEYAGRMEVVFFDVREDKEAGDKYGIRMIPTQIFLSENGTEIFRHEGFISKEDILALWKKLGITFGDTEGSDN